MIFNLKVIQEDIDLGIREEADLCALARTFKRELKTDEVKIGENEGEVQFTTNDGTEYKAVLPLNAVEFYHNFDDCEVVVTPFEFSIDADVVGPEPEDFYENT